MVAIRANDRIPGASCEHSITVWGKESASWAMDRNMGVKAAEMAMREIKKTGKKKIFMVFEPQWGLLVKNPRQVLDCQVWVLIQD